MRAAYNVLIIAILLFSCDSNDNQLNFFCSVDNPIEDLDWLKNEIDEREQNITDDSKYLYISQSSHDGESVIIYADCCPTCNSVYVVFNCVGENIGFIGDGNFTSETLSSGEVIWKTDKNLCSF